MKTPEFNQPTPLPLLPRSKPRMYRPKLPKVSLWRRLFFGPPKDLMRRG